MVVHVFDIMYLTKYFNKINIFSVSIFYFVIIINLTNNAKLKIVSEYGQEIPQSQTADNPMAPRGRATKPSRDARKTN